MLRTEGRRGRGERGGESGLRSGSGIKGGGGGGSVVRVLGSSAA